MSAKEVIEAAIAKGIKLTTAESCTGGGLGAALTAISGASKAYEGGFITYSNVAKSTLLGVEAALITKHGAVSAPVAQAMAQGALIRMKADIALAITGIAGPKSDDTQKPVGLVYTAIASKQGVAVREHHFGEIGRENVREKSIAAALEIMLKALKNPAL
jgi:nicotinamide-nucleotide amidase